MKSKNSGSRSSTLKSTSASKTSSLKSTSAKSTRVKSDSGTKGASAKVMQKGAAPKAGTSQKGSSATTKTPVPDLSKVRPLKVTNSTTVTVVERLSAARMAKSGEVVALKAQTLKLKLVAKSGTQIPASKITRSDAPVSSRNVVAGRFGSDAAPARPALAVRPSMAGPLTDSDSGNEGNVVFKAGDKIVYPGHGVGEIESVRTTTLSGEEHHLYNIKILETGMKVMVPLKQASSVGIRRIIDKKGIDRVYEILKDRDFKIDTQTWNRRFREYSQKIMTGSVFEIAIVLRDLSVLSADKELSFGEKKMLEKAESLLVSEIAIAKARPQDKIVGELKALFAV